MSERSVIALGIVAVAFSAFVFFYERHTLTTGEVEGRGDSLIERFVRARVERLEIERGGESLVLVRQRDEEGELGDWRMVEPVRAAADQDAVDSLLGALEWASARRTLEGVTAEDRRRFGFDEPRVRATITVANEQIPLAIGGEDPTESGIYVQLGDPAMAYVAGEDLFEALDREPTHYRSRELFADVVVDNAERLELAGGGPNRRVEKRDGRFWLVASGRESYASRDAVSAALRALSGLTATRFVAERPGDLSRYGLDRPTLRASGRITRSGSDPARFELKVGSACPDHEGESHARADNGPIVCVRDADLEALRRSEADLREMRLVSSPAEDVVRVELVAGSRRLELTEDEDDGSFAWVAKNGSTESRGEADADSVTEWLEALRRARAEELADPADSQGLGSPAATLTLHLRDEGATEVVRLGAASEAAFARRGEEPVVLRLRPVAAELFDASPVRFRSRALLTEQADHVTRVTIERGAVREVLQKVDDDWRVTAPIEAEADAADTRGLAEELAGLAAVRFAAAEPAEAHGLGTPRAIATVRFEGGEGEPREHRVKIGAAADDGGAYAQLDSDPAVFVILGSIADRLTTPRISRGLLGTDSSDLESIAVVRGDARVELHRDGEAFRRGGGEADEETRDVVDRLARLRASATTEYGPAAAAHGLPGEARIVVTRREGASAPATYEIVVGGPTADGEGVHVRRADLEVGFTLPEETVRAFLEY